MSIFTLKHLYALLFCVLHITSSLASNQATMMSSAFTQTPSQINIINAISHTNLPLKKEIRRLYEMQDFQPIWSDGTNYNDNAKQLLEIIKQADNLGLNPIDYDSHLIQSFLEATVIDANLLSKSDIVFSHAYVKLASHVNQGKHIKPQKFLNDQGYLSILSKATKSSSINTTLKELQPEHSHYKRLIQALKQYKNINHDNQKLILQNQSLSLGDRSDEIPKLRKILHYLGDYSNDDLSSNLFDESLMVALSDYQIRHGLEPDGILGKETARELNTPIEHRITQLEVNLARSKSLPTNKEDRYLLVNIPAYELYLHENDQIKFQTRVVVGKKKNKTPLISSELKRIVLNPYWNVPRSITQKEIIPAIQKDPLYLAKNNMKLFGRLNNKSYQLNPDAIDWNNIDPTNTNFRIRQDPGAKNSLGQIKFLFPNHYSVYLHDTPARNLFALPKRAFSHGCIRLEDPYGLAEAVLSTNGIWSKNDLIYLAKRNKQKTFTLHNPHSYSYNIHDCLG